MKGALALLLLAAAVPWAAEGLPLWRSMRGGREGSRRDTVSPDVLDPALGGTEPNRGGDPPGAAPCPAAAKALAARYIESIQKSVTGIHLRTPSFTPGEGPQDKLGIEPFVGHKRHGGADWPVYGYAMTGLIRLKNVQELLEDVFARDVPGDFMECGVWRGGASIVARAVMVAHDQTHRRVILADSFKGLPPARSGEDVDSWSRMEALAVSKDQVREHFENMDLLDDRVEFVEGFFGDSLPPFRTARSRDAPIAVLRADGDMYESCMDILINLYTFVPVGGYCIIDDWSGFPCKKAVEQFRAHVGADEPIVPIPVSGVYWKKEKDVRYSPRRAYRELMRENRGATSR